MKYYLYPIFYSSIIFFLTNFEKDLAKDFVDCTFATLHEMDYHPYIISWCFCTNL